MEVHHHSHSQGKKWTHYFWEFLMLFLAVFCGFLAENIREHRVEHQREKQFMVSMLEDLKSDTGMLDLATRYWDTINHSIDSVAEAIRLPANNARLVTAYRYINKALDYYSFTYNDRTIAQLKNSGGFRLVRNNKVANEIILYDQFNNDAMKNIADMHAAFYKTMMQLANKVFVQEIINEVFRRYDLEPAGIADAVWIENMLRENKNPLTVDAFNATLFEFKNAVLSYRKDYDQNMKFGYRYLQRAMRDLIRTIKEEYHL